MKYFAKIYLIALALLLGSAVYAQERVVRGVVTDQSDGFPLPGASVIIKNENDRMISGVTTDVDGRYMISFSIPNAIIQISFIGMKPYEVPVGTQTVINVALEPEAASIESLVITGQTRARVDMGFIRVDARDNAAAVSSIDISRISHSSATSAIEMMQGRAAGVQITAESGDPGAGHTITIRGSTSVNSNSNPLIVIDGIQYTGNVGDFSDIMELTTSRSPLQDVHPDDIESIEVLKDAGSTAMYGSRGANGVILITTKRGRAEYTQVTLASNASVSFLPKDIPLLSGDDLKIFILEGTQNSGAFGGTNFLSPVFPELRDNAARPDFYEHNNNTDWVDAVQRVAWTLKNNFSLSGGGNSTVYRFSLGTINQQGTIIGKSYDMFSTSFNLDYMISRSLRLSSSIAYSRSNTADGGDNVHRDHGVLGFARAYPSFYPIYWPDGDGGFTDQYYVPFNTDITLYNRNMYNPVAWGNLVTNDRAANTFRSNVSIVFNILPGLVLSSRVNFNFNSNSVKMFTPHAATNRMWHETIVNHTYRGKGNDQFIGQENHLSYSLTLNEIHEFNVGGNARFEWRYDNSFSQGASNTGSERVTGMSAATRWNALNSERNTDAYNSFGIIGHYKLLDRYIIQPSIAYEGSSRFGEGNRYGAFPMLALRWRFSSEPFLQSLTFMDDVSFRYSWGQSGNAPRERYLYFSVYDAGGTRYIDQVGTTSGGLQLNTLKWEVTTTNNLGFDALVFNSRIRLTVDAFDRLTEDLLMQRSLPASTGSSTFWTNHGNVRQRGLEFDMRTVILNTSDFYLDVSGNISFVKNRLEYLPEDSGVDIDWYQGYPFMVREGDPIGAFYGFRYKGVYATDEDAVAIDRDGNPIIGLDGMPRPVRWDSANGSAFLAGDAIYEDLNNDGIINNLDRTIIGNANAAFFGGFGSRFQWREWSLDVFFQYQYGNDVINLVRKDLETMNGGNQANRNQSQSVMRRWRKQGDITDIPRVTFDTHRNAEGSNRFVEDASYIRLKSVALSYQVPSSFTSRIGVARANVFVNAYNLYTWTNYLGVDPEISMSGSRERPFRIGLDSSRTPVPRSITFGFSVNF